MRKLREAAGLAAQVVAQRAGVHYSVLSRMETGKLPVDLDDYTGILRAIDTLVAERDVRWQEALQDLGMGRVRVEPEHEGATA
jgi:transcriptional regulator with XRE-family HTH domain